MRSGHLVIIPTDTVYGLAADRHNANAVQMLHRVKGRPADKPIPMLASDRKHIEKLKACFGEKGSALAAHFWPGPLTLVLPVENGGWEGFRIPKHAVALAIIEAAGGLLRVTSANLSGHRPPLTAAAALKELGKSVKLVIDAGPAPGGVPSTVVKITDEKVTILRPGAISREAILAASGTQHNHTRLEH